MQSNDISTFGYDAVGQLKPHYRSVADQCPLPTEEVISMTISFHRLGMTVL